MSYRHAGPQPRIAPRTSRRRLFWAWCRGAQAKIAYRRRWGCLWQVTGSLPPYALRNVWRERVYWALMTVWLTLLAYDTALRGDLR